jgi:beta-lactamase regulating signal transducer with metallopeptidase domain
LKIPFDLIIFLTLGESLFVNFNPLSCEIYVFDLLAKIGLVKMMSGSDHLIIPQYIAAQLPKFVINSLTLAVVLLTLGGIARKMYQLYLSRAYLKNILRSSSKCQRIILNLKLFAELKKRGASIFISSEITVPFATNSHAILIPQRLLDKLSQEEFEAIISHELEHLRWKDPLIKFLCSCICSLFWWIPSKWWLKRIIAEQEVACDATVDRYAIDNHALATALTKSLQKKSSFTFDPIASCLFDPSKSGYLQRLHFLLNSDAITRNNRYATASLIGAAFCFIPFLSFWMC